jgi:hypothetical protein
MVILEVADTRVAYSKALKQISRRSEWDSIMNEHDALFRGYQYDQMVRQWVQGLSYEEFESEGSDQTYCSPTGACMYSAKKISDFWWQRTEIHDKAIGDGKFPQNFVLSNGDSGTNNFEHNTQRAERMRANYLTGVLQDFDKGAQIPGILKSSITSLLEKWKPQIPLTLPAAVKPDILKWDGKAKADELWSDKTVSVRYLFTLKSTIGNESDKSNDLTSSTWYEPQGNCRPEIIGLPVEGDYLNYVHSICVYRQFKKALAGGSYKLGKPRMVKVITRVNDKKVFADSFVDAASTEHDAKELTEG